MALSTKSIALIAAARRSKAQDRGASSRRSSLHPPEGSRDPSPADGRWPCSSRARGRSVERKASAGPSPCLTHGLQQVGGCRSRQSSPRGPARRQREGMADRGPWTPGGRGGRPGAAAHPPGVSQALVTAARGGGGGFWSLLLSSCHTHFPCTCAVFAFQRQEGAWLGCRTHQATDTCVRGGVLRADRGELLRLSRWPAPGGHTRAPSASAQDRQPRTIPLMDTLRCPVPRQMAV